MSHCLPSSSPQSLISIVNNAFSNSGKLIKNFYLSIFSANNKAFPQQQHSAEKSIFQTDTISEKNFEG